MKRTTVNTIALLALLIGAGHASAQRPPHQVSPDAAKEQYQRTEQRAVDLRRKLLKDKQDGRDVGLPELREKMRPLAEESFEARQRLQRAELEALRRRLGDIEQAIENRERNKEALVNARIEDWLNRTDSEEPETRPRNNPNPVPAGQTRWSEEAGGADFNRLTPPPRQSASDLDIETREQLAELDVQAAEGDYQAAAHELSQASQLHQAASISKAEVGLREKDYRHAAIELKRAKLKLEGLARQRTELEDKADAAIDQALSQEREAMSRLNTSKAKIEAAQADVVAAEAVVAKAKATCEYREKQYQRVKKLVEEKAVDMNALDEVEEHLETSKAGLDEANAALAVAVANVNQSKKAIEEVVAQAKGAAARVHAAKVDRGRLGRRRQGETTAQDAPARPNSQ